VFVSAIPPRKNNIYWYWHSPRGTSLYNLLNLLLCNVLCHVAKDVVASHGTLVTLFERIRMFLQRLSIYTEIPLTLAMTELLGKIMGQVLSILALSTKE
jgi:hypothetical protein